MEKANKLGDVPQEQRAEMLKEMAFKTDVSKVRRHFNQEEMEQKRDTVINESLELMKNTEEFKAILQEFNKEKKAANEEIKKALKNIQLGFTDNEEQVFLFDDQDNGEIHIFDKFGVYLSSRPLYPEERQTKILEMNRTGTNG